MSRLVGSPPGYVGYDEGGQLTEAVRRKPYSVLLLDEIEKAHPDVFNILLQILEDGKLTDAQGRKVDFRNTIVIMTSNIGAAQISKNQSLGFTLGDETGLTYDDMKGRVMGELKKVFRPELLNRIDEIIVFHKLEKSEILQIVDLMMKRLRDQMAIHGATIELTDDAQELLVEQGYDPAMGARPLRRSIQRLIEDPLADFVLGRDLTEGSTILIDRRHELTGIEGESLVEITVIEGEEAGQAGAGDGSARRRARARRRPAGRARAELTHRARRQAEACRRRPASGPASLRPSEPEPCIADESADVVRPGLEQWHDPMRGGERVRQCLRATDRSRRDDRASDRCDRYGRGSSTQSPRIARSASARSSAGVARRSVSSTWLCQRRACSGTIGEVGDLQGRVRESDSAHPLEASRSRLLLDGDQYLPWHGSCPANGK